MRCNLHVVGWIWFLLNQAHSIVLFAKLVIVKDDHKCPLHVHKRWDCWTDPDCSVLLSCAPSFASPHLDKSKDQIPWRDHWMQAVYYPQVDYPWEKFFDIPFCVLHIVIEFWNKNFSVFHGGNKGWACEPGGLPWRVQHVVWPDPRLQPRCAIAHAPATAWPPDGHEQVPTTL